jgi:hypothetical protein
VKKVDGTDSCLAAVMVSMTVGELEFSKVERSAGYSVDKLVAYLDASSVDRKV